MGIPFVREMNFTYGEAQQVSPLIRRVVARNPGPFTFHGTGVYIVGAPGGEVAVIDPGPDDAAHIEALKAALRDDRVAHIFVTHGHLDHAPAARPLAEATGARIHASGARTKRHAGAPRMDEDEDEGFRPDHALSDGEIIRGDGWTMEAIFTPGHTSNHVCYALHEENALFSGDHIMGWSTTVVSPPDGDMDDYLASLEKVRARNFATLWPTHGPPIREVRAFIDAYEVHRLDREAQILAQLRAGRTKIADMVPVMYADVNPALHPAARHSVYAHMIRLAKRGVVSTSGAPAPDSEYRLA